MNVPRQRRLPYHPIRRRRLTAADVNPYIRMATGGIVKPGALLSEREGHEIVVNLNKPLDPQLIIDAIKRDWPGRL